MAKYEDSPNITGYDFRTAIAAVAPNYSIDKDNYGQIVIYTNKKEIDDDIYVEMTGPDFEIYDKEDKK